MNIKFIFFLVLSYFSLAQEPVTWSIEVKRLDSLTVEVQFDADIESNWNLYGIHEVEDGPLPTEIIWNETEENSFQILSLSQSQPIVKIDAYFGKELEYFQNKAVFIQKLKVPLSVASLSGEISYQACDDKVCIFRAYPFELVLIEGTKKINEQTIDLEENKNLKLNLKNTELLSETNAKAKSNSSIWNIFWLGMIGGLLALLTPCVFPMIPLTVSYFLKQSTTSRKGILNALFYAFCIVLVYFSLSLPFHFIGGISPTFLNSISTNVTLNLIFFGVFVFFAFSFFGLYDLSLPSKWSNVTDSNSSMNGIFGIFFMALTLAIVSFSCTGPILGSLLAGSLSATGGALQLTAGMVGFGVALAFPFFLFAVFPNTLNKLPKSGSWMTSIKIILGFLELALALKFLSNADLVSHWGILKREIFIGVWILILLLLSLYLLGVLKFKAEGNQKPSIFRKIMGWLSMGFTVYMLIVLLFLGNQFKWMSGFPPPQFYSVFETETDCPLNLNCYKSFDVGLEDAKQQNKMILLDFTGYACVNCRKMEENVWSVPKVYQFMKENLVIISLYVDDRAKLPEGESFRLKNEQGGITHINTVGKKWGVFQYQNFQTASQPYYVLLTPELEILNVPVQYTSEAAFYNWLKDGENKFLEGKK